ncbi:MAG TPA: VWA domain-containing protein [Thermoanaerobaculia bacterium]
MCSKVAWLFGALVLGGIALGAEEIKALAPDDFGATVDVRVVNVEAVARDSAGHPVQGLTAADFRLTVDGREVPIEYFTEVSEGEEVASRPAGVPPTTPVKVGTSYLIFVDDSFSIDVQRNRVLSRLEQDLRLGPEDRVAIVVYDGKPALLSGWTGDINQVRKILDQVQKLPVRRVFELWNPGVEGAEAAASVAMRGLPSLPGRKVFLLVSGGWPELVAHSEVAPAEVSPLSSEVPLEKIFEPVADTANLLGYTVYFLEVPGVSETLGAGSDFAPAQTLPSSRFALVQLGENLSPYQNLWQLARRTGGTAVLYSLHRSSLERVEGDARSHYSFAFSPEWRGDGRRHHIQVEVRKPGVRVRSRDGYFDMTPRMQAMIKSENMLLFGRGTTIQAVAGKPLWAGLGAINLPVTLAVPARMLTARPVAGGYELKVTVLATSLDDWGLGERHPNTPLVLTLAKAPQPDDVIPFTVTLNLNTLGQQLAFVVLDGDGAGVGRGRLDWHRRPQG